ncbi:cytochrome c oxidase assembly protein [Paenibacillus sp. MZ04-78.2]|uniref:cytochrome c oxidase assembly protein n=1 Tax=Paenibacillus sp. MZ04-78.2 TaxID=2962034 RepID=UPI0020B79C6D|nr:cytochrome c oxidase assembly protein [Paenibacillus sp. MZ04-78.2]MCP3774084.1 cytochrome c oxidase assembly protein [Paenibacillus sp. MZ04-78.2]
MNHESFHHEARNFVELGLAMLVIVALVLYVYAAVVSGRRSKPWPFYRYVCWFIGVGSVAAALIGPLAHQSLMDFTAHMAGHLLLGMLAPLLLAFAAPMTLLLKALPVTRSRKLSHVLKSWPLTILTNPLTTAFLNIGGLWILYATDLFRLMHQSLIIHLLMHVHVFLAGYLSTASMIYVDPAPHRKSFLYRAAVLVLALAGHGMLSKYIYGHPPAGVSGIQAEQGGKLMYYGGDAIDVVLIFIFCLQWFKAARPRMRVAAKA